MQDGSDSEMEKRGRKEEQGNEGMEMEVTFGGGLDDLSARLKAKAEEKVNKKNDTVWQAYLRKREYGPSLFTRLPTVEFPGFRHQSMHINHFGFRQTPTEICWLKVLQAQRR